MMKRVAAIIAVLMAVALPAGAQHYFGVRGGYGGGMARFFPPEETGSLWGLYNAGISYKFYSKEKYLGGLEADLHYIQKGYKEPDANMPDTVYTHWVNTIELPFFWQPHLYVSNRDFRIFLNLGVVFSYNLDAYEESRSRRDPTDLNAPFYTRRPYDMTLVRDNRWGYGLCGGFGVNYIVGRFELVAEARYNIGYSDLYKNHTVYPPNRYQKSPVDNLYFSAGVYFRLSKDGIRSAASASTAQKISEREARRTSAGAGKKKAAAQSGEPAVETPEETSTKTSTKTPAETTAEPEGQPVSQPESQPAEEESTPPAETPAEAPAETPETLYGAGNLYGKIQKVIIDYQCL